MAGIGFELKRKKKKDSLISVLSGAAYSTVVVSGPTIIVMCTLLALYGALGYMDVIYTDRELLSSSILYILYPNHKISFLKYHLILYFLAL